jgi:16S rRNA (cytosine1402-N4)-methyltransferase
MRTRRFKSSGDPVRGTPASARDGSPTRDGHRSVLLHEAIDALNLGTGKTVVDATLGGAGHAKEIITKLGKSGTLVGFDADIEAIERSRTELADAEPKTFFVHSNFALLEEKLLELGIARVDAVLFDLGWSGYQLSAGRGFSFRSDEPLRMTYDAAHSLTAETIVNEWEQQSLADVIYGWGEERYARRIAKAIVMARENAPIRTSRQLADIILSAVPQAYRRGRLHPATKTFQALRIAVNDELGALDKGLTAAWSLLMRGGRIAVISFHSLEDRDVKRRFLEWEKAGEGRRITKKPVPASFEECKENPRARSAKLRVIEKL